MERRRPGRLTVIGALHCNRTRTTWIASDTASASGDLRLPVGPKWILRWPWAVGVAGHLRTKNVFEQQADALLGDLAGPEDFCQRAREALKADGYNGSKDETGPLEFGQAMMLAGTQGTWTLGPDFSFTSIAAGRFWAEGSGRELAIGAAHALQAVDPDMAARDIVRLAIDAAIAHDFACGGPPWIAELSSSAPVAGT